MGKHANKTAYKKFLKQEKARVKLKKSHKTLLPKGQNITNTNFKVKKIVIKEQLRSASDSNEAFPRTHGNIKELLSKLQHHNAPLRSHSVDCLMEFIRDNGSGCYIARLPSILQRGAQLLLDREHDIRDKAIKLLGLILSQVTENQLDPVFDVLTKYLACCMSHIDANIRESSLKMLDVLVNKCPQLTAKHCQGIILPAFLDLISTKETSDRKLIMQYSDKSNSTLWRIKVFQRLCDLLKAIVDNQQTRSKEVDRRHITKEMKFNDSGVMYIGLYSNRYGISESSLATPTSSESTPTTTDIQAYTELLVPLMMDAFVEVAPKMKNKGYLLTEEAVIILRYVTRIMILLLKIFGTADNSKYLEEWFSARFSASILNQLVTGRFPYGTIVSEQKLSKKNKFKQNSASSLPKEMLATIQDEKCTGENLAVCHVCLSIGGFCEDKNSLETVCSYVIDLMKIYDNLDSECVDELFSCVDCLLKHDAEKLSPSLMVSLVTTIKENYDNATRNQNDNNKNNKIASKRLFTFLQNVALHPHLKRLRKEPAIVSWLNDLPKMLTRRCVSYEVVKSVSNIARCNLLPFVNSLDAYIETILDNLPRLDVLCERKSQRLEAKRMICNLLYFVKNWDVDFVSSVKKGISCQYFGNLNSHVEDIVLWKHAECGIGIK